MKQIRAIVVTYTYRRIGPLGKAKHEPPLAICRFPLSFACIALVSCDGARWCLQLFAEVG